MILPFKYHDWESVMGAENNEARDKPLGKVYQYCL